MKKIAAIGEVLFDNFDGKEMMGGAPFNFIYHLRQFENVFHLRLEPKLITKVGRDKRGQLVKNTFEQIGLCTQVLQISDIQKTGLVNVFVNATGSPEYDIVENSAYDFIDYGKEEQHFLSNNISFFYFGSLFQRTNYNRNTLSRCISEDNHHIEKIFYDINIRQNYYSFEIIDESLLSANYLKINDEELQLLQNRFFKHLPLNSETEFVEYLVKEYMLDAIILTKGKNGGMIINHKLDLSEHPGIAVKNLTDTVGAGDAFSSIFALGVLFQWSMDTTLQRAIEFSAEICRIKGAIPEDTTWYEQFQNWFV